MTPLAPAQLEPLAGLLTVGQVRAAVFTMKMHINMDDGHVMIWESQDVPGLSVIKRSPKGRSKERASQVFAVRGWTQDFLTLAEAVAALNSPPPQNEDEAKRALHEIRCTIADHQTEFARHKAYLTNAGMHEAGAAP